MYLVYFLIFPGFLFTALVGIIASWIDRKVTARVQWRVGPPWYQPMADIVKLLGKQTMVPEGGEIVSFLTAPLFGLAGITLVSTILWLTSLGIVKGFVGDIIVVFYLMAIPSIAVIIGASASGNPLASLGASREMKLILSYELPFILAIFTAIIKMGGIIRISNMVSYQAANGVMLGNWSCVIAFVVAIFCMQAKLALVPFDMPEAETEIMGGTHIEYSGPPLAVFKLTKMMMLFTVPMFLIVVFWGGMVFSHVGVAIYSIIKYVILLVVIVLIRNTNPRVRIDHAMRFFWGPMTLLAIVGVILAFLGR